MTTNVLDKTENYKTDYSAYGGEIDLDDFNTYSPNKKRISNQIDANNLSENIRKEKERKNLALTYTLEELREMRLVSNTNGRPTSLLTNEKWQREFELRKCFITPYEKNVKKLGGRYSKAARCWNEETMGEYKGETNWQEYCSYINDVLSNIRAGQVDYCYYIYQIMQLLKFHYNDLKTKYCDGYWEVWLER